MSIPTQESRFLSRGIDYLGDLGAKLKDLQGYATLAHELLQNADDAQGVSAFTFNVRDDALLVDNNATFSDCGQIASAECPWKTDPAKLHRCDFHRFRRIASGDKRGQANTTGAFGIGFISVYQITDNPELFSAGRHWLIHEERDEDHRIEQCTGCPACKDPGLPNTRFYLPWASDPTSALRTALRAEATTPETFANLIKELQASLPTAMLFLKHLDKVAVLEDGKPLRTLERVPPTNGELLLTDNNKNDRIWYILKGNFAEKAAALRAAYPNKIEDKRSSDIALAIPHADLENGLFCACLPTQHGTGLPFHINADFFPSNDRKRIILEQDYQSAWNRAAIHAAASTLADNFGLLPARLGHLRFWALLSRLQQVANEANAGHTEKTLADFWTLVTPKLPALPIVFTTVKAWRKPSEAFLLYSKEEAAALPLLEKLNVPIVNEELRPHHNLLSGNIVGVKTLSASNFSEALKAQGLTKHLPKEQWPDFLKQPGALASLWQQVEKLVSRHAMHAFRRLALDDFKPLSLVLGRDGALWPCKSIYRADDGTRILFSALDPTIPFAAPEIEDHACLQELCVNFGVYAAVHHLQQLGKDGLSKAIQGKRLNLPDLFAWLDARKSTIAADQDLKAKLSALPIFPSAGALKPLAGLALPGDFKDPLQLAALIDVEALAGRRDFLRDLGAPELSFSNYACDHLPNALAQNDLPPQKRRDAALLLASHHGEIMDDDDCRQALAATAIVECDDGQFRTPADAYFRNDIILEVLGGTVPLAKIPGSHEVALTAFYAWLGLEKQPRFESIISRVQTLVAAPPNSTTLASVKKIFIHLSTRVGSPTLPGALAPLKTLAWLPARQHPERWFRPSELYAVFQDYLFESQVTFLDFDRATQTSSTDLLNGLGVSTTPTVFQVVEHLLHCADKSLPVNQEVYRFLNEKSDSPAVGQLRGKRCLLLQDGSYIDPAHVFWSEHPFGRFRMRLGPELRKYSDLFQRLGIRDIPTHQDALTLLLEISSQFGARNTALDEEARSVLLACWRMLETAQDQETLSPSDLHGLRETKCVPNVEHLLTQPTWMFFEDRAGLAAKFDGFLRSNVIPRPIGAHKAMAAAGVRALASAVELQLLECDNPAESTSVKQRLTERKDQISRVLHAQSEHVSPEAKLTELDRIRFESADLLRISYRLDAFGRTLNSAPEDCPALFQSKENLLRFVTPNGRFPWAPIARELALALYPDLEPGRIAPGLKEVFSAETAEAAKTALDELGFVILDTTKAAAPAGATISALGGEAPPPDQPVKTQQAETTATRAPDRPVTPSGGGTPDSVTAILGPGASSTPPPSELNKSELPAGTRPGGSGAGGGPDGNGRPGGRRRIGGGSRPHTGQRGTRRGKLRSYVVHDGTPNDTPPDPEAAQCRSALAEAGIAKVVAYEQSCERKPDVKPHFHKGYDIESRDAAGEIVRYIEVKSMSGLWDECGVGLTYPEFEKAQQLGDKYWLYVVERADQSDTGIYPIQNPALKVDQFMYDDGWSEAAEPS